MTILTKQHDTKITFTDIPSIDGVIVPPANLVGCTLKFLMKGDTIAISQVATILPDGTFTYAPAPTDVATPGDYKQEWEVMFPGNKPLTFPNGSYNVVKILPDLG